MSLHLDPTNTPFSSDNAIISKERNTQNSSWFSRNIISLTHAEKNEIVDAARIGLIQILFAEAITLITSFAYLQSVHSPLSPNLSLKVVSSATPVIGLMIYSFGSQLLIRDRASAHTSISCLLLGIMGGTVPLWLSQPYKDYSYSNLKNVMETNAMMATLGTAFSAFIRLGAIKMPETNMSFKDYEKHMAAKLEIQHQQASLI